MDLPNRHTTRAQWHDYNNGTYHVILNSRDRIHSFGEIENGEMQLSDLGQNLKQNIESTIIHNPYAQIPIFQIMPDHIHLLVIIHQAEAQGCKDDACIVQSDEKSIVQSTTTSLDPKMKKVSDRRGNLSVVISGIKSATTKYANANNIPFHWVQRFYDCIIKDDTQMSNTINYIKSNVANWGKDLTNATYEK